MSSSAARVRLLHEWVTRQTDRRPQAIAVVCEEEELSYGGLEAAANRLARMLRGVGCRRGDRVALLMHKSPAAIAAILAIYKADAVFVPLDPGSPVPRLAKILRSCDSRLVLAGDGTGPLLEQLRLAGLLQGVLVGWLGGAEELAGREVAAAFSRGDVALQPAEPPACHASGDDPAHLLYTSGSTGDPKGVAISHANLVRFVEWAVGHFRIEPGERLSGHSPLHFDLSSFDLFGAFAAGAELHLIPPELNLLPHRLAELIRRARLTQCFLVPSVLCYMTRFDVVGPGDFPELRRLLWCGEVFPTPALAYWMDRLPHVAFTNLYGPTETTVASSYYDVPACPEDPRASVPIGGPCAGEDLLLLDPRLQPVAAGEVGEIYIRGAGLSPGYWRQPGRTAAVFVPDPAGSGRLYRTGDLGRRDEGGRIHFLGRADSQIKSRGYRIELGEIESAVAAVGLAEEAVVTAIPSGDFEGQLICCAYVPAAGREAGPGEVRRELSRLLPAYMLPARWKTGAELPRNANGKLDRKRIRAMFEAERTPAAVGALPC